MLHELIYTSIAEPEIDLQAILDQCNRENPKHNITGCLIYDATTGQFTQLVEGDMQDVIQLFDNIKKDKRHTSVIEVYSGAIKDRSFPDWTMRLVNKDVIPQYIKEEKDIMEYISLNQGMRCFEEINTRILRKEQDVSEVVDILKYRLKKIAESLDIAEELGFDEVIKKNKEKEEKRAKEREKNNEKVVRTHRLKK